MKTVMIAALSLMMASSVMAQPVVASVQHGSGQGKIQHKHHKANTVCFGKLCYKPFHGVFIR